MRTTRTEIVGHVADAFMQGDADRAGLVAAARRNGASDDVVEALESLPDRRYRHVRDLWTEIPEVPVGT